MARYRAAHRPSKASPSGAPPPISGLFMTTKHPCAALDLGGDGVLKQRPCSLRVNAVSIAPPERRPGRRSKSGPPIAVSRDTPKEQPRCRPLPAGAVNSTPRAPFGLHVGLLGKMKNGRRFAPAAKAAA
jgi:hypothetical protein